MLLSLKHLEEVVTASQDKMVGEFWSEGADDLFTVAENKDAFMNFRIVPRYMRNVAAVDPAPAKPLFGRRYAMPVGIAPSSLHMLATPAGEAATAGAAAALDVPMAISSYSNCSLEDARAAGPGSLVFFQLYVFQNRATSEALVRRAEAAGYKALLLTIDSAYLGRRYADERNKFTLPPHVTLGNFAGAASGPVDMSIESKSQGKGTETVRGGATKPNVIDPALEWADIAWLRSITKLEIWVKGLLAPEDAEAAVAAGVDGIWVSNHGGRQLDGTLPTIEALPAVVAAVRGRVPVHMDGGVRRGTDVFKALALGADYVWIGRPALWGLKYNGQAGLEETLQLLLNEFKLAMALSGTTAVSQIDRSYLARARPGLTKL
ncbi:FMN-dependent dehydrogenase [Dipodascopsis tothii]|uniref:FMN-dependent dehydrogenase n=1 Tax=Dipodascopsis tothii TaxID=44089 RepID=UPI0034CDB83E